MFCSTPCLTLLLFVALIAQLYQSMDENDNDMFQDVPIDSEGEGDNDAYIRLRTSEENLYDQVAGAKEVADDESNAEFLKDDSMIDRGKLARHGQRPAERFGSDSQDDDDDSTAENEEEQEPSMSSLFGFGNDPMLAGLMDGLMSSEKMITKRKLEVMERKNEQLQRQLSRFKRQDAHGTEMGELAGSAEQEGEDSGGEEVYDIADNSF